MNRGAWQATVLGVAKTSDTTERLTHGYGGTSQVTLMVESLTAKQET